jgi:dynein heavy chain 2
MLDEAIGYVASLEKMLASANNPNVLMVGRSGVGRQTSLQLAALILKLDLLRLPTLREFTAREFRKEMKVVLERVANDNKRTVLFLEDHNFSQPDFIEMVNSLIISGEIPGLFNLDEIERMPAADAIRG